VTNIFYYTQKILPIKMELSVQSLLIVLVSLPLLAVGILSAVAYHILRPPKVVSKSSHEEKSRQLQADFNRNQQDPKPVCTSRSQNDSMTTRNTIASYKANASLVNMESFNQILAVNEKDLYVEVESRVTIGELIDHIVPMGFTIGVVPELRTLTIGGLICGAGIESSSHRNGLFMNCCVMYRVLLGDGSIHEVTAQSNPELFSWIPFSSGSLCLFLSARIQLIRIPPIPVVLLTYSAVHSDTEAIQALTQTCTARQQTDSHYADFIEGILFTKDDGVIVRGMLCDGIKDSSIPCFSIKWYSPFWYYHVKSAFWKKTKAAPMKEYMPLIDYYFRHDRGIFWTLERKFPIVLSPIFRVFFGWTLDSRLRRMSMLSDRSSVSEVKREHKRVVQDPIVPLSRGVQSLRLFDNIFGITPIWLCPFKVIPLPRSSLLLFPEGRNGEYAFYLDIGLYAVPTAADYDPVASHRKMEAFLRSQHGFVAPYSVCYSTPAEFWAMYNKDNYEKARELTQSKNRFVDLYSKIGGGEKVSQFEIEAGETNGHITNGPLASH
jgi:FAD/FMN-containing dehydrogenase